jgi:integrase/recombinase XerC
MLVGCSNRMTVTDVFELYRKNVIVFRNQSYKTEENHTYALKSLLAFLGKDIELEALSFELVRDWKIALEKKHLSQATIRGYLIKLRVVLTYLQQRGVNVLNPDLIALPRRENKPVDFLKKEDVLELIRVAGLKGPGYPKINRLRNQAIISFLYGSGVRVSEMCRLDRDSIHQRTFTAYGKGNKSRVAFIDDRTEVLLNQYLVARKDSISSLFLATASQKRVTPGAVQEIIRGIGKKAGFNKPIHPHIFRHSYATNLLFNNTNPRYVQTLLGHSSLDTTMQYMNIVNEDLKAVYDTKHTV